MNLALGGMAATVIPPQSSTSRGLPTNPAQGVRRIPPPTYSMPPIPPPPIPEKYHVPNNSGSTLSAKAPMSSAQVISLASAAMQAALLETQNQTAESNAVGNEHHRLGVTIDLSRKNIASLPDEVVQIIKNDLERLALSHNSISAFPASFSECTSLRYLNVRQNQIKEFPLALCDLKSLEILDLGRNQIRVIPPDVAKMTSLKVLAIPKNQIEELPLCLADMVSLQRLRVDGNPITFPPRDMFSFQANSPQNENLDIITTSRVKKFLKQHAINLSEKERDAEHGGDESTDGGETPRMPLKRVVSGRFPIRVNGNDMVDPRSPAILRPPPIPNRSHARVLSQQTTAVRRPSVMPLTIGNPNERVRSNSETVLQASRPERTTDRSRRMGIVSRQPSELGSLDETQANNRFSHHYRGLSHGSSMTGTALVSAVSTASPSSPAEPLLQRPNYVRRLSVLPEQRRESTAMDPIVESAKGILYSIFQIHHLVQLFTRLTSDGTTKRSSLEIVFYNTNGHVEQLEQEIQKHETAFENGDYAPRENENVQRAVLTLIKAYRHICSLLVGNMDTIVENGDPRYIRTMMSSLYNSIMELRVSSHECVAGHTPSYGARRPNLNDTIKPHARESSITPTTGRSRSRLGTFVHNPSNLRVATDAPLSYINGTGRTAQITSATPRSGESFASSSTDPRYPADFSADERQFEKIFLSLQKSTDLLTRTLPNLNVQFNTGKRNAELHGSFDVVMNSWNLLIAKCTIAIEATEALKGRLSVIKLKEPGIRTDATFWSRCKHLIESWFEFGNMLKQTMKQVKLSGEVKSRLPLIQASIKEANNLIMASPWGVLFKHTGQFSDSRNTHGPNHYSSNSTHTQIQLPMTPQSAALGPAVQATVPSTPQSGSFAKAFAGDVFERADTLISQGGLSMPISRTNTMNSASTISLNSITSISSVGDPTTLSPNGNGVYRSHVGNKPAF
ncbi:RAM signaling pathway protein [Xylariaceae sp. FL1019]|nr:RAM signaling pathway protein [Xylariaceae sp. FL1019]